MMNDQLPAQFDLRASVVVYNNRPDMVGRVLSDLLQCGFNVDADVVDNSGMVDYRSILGDRRLHYIRTGRNVGYGRGHNVSLRRSLDTAPYHLVLNPDVTFVPGTLEEIYDYMEQNKDVGQLMPRIVSRSGSLQYLCKLLPTPVDLFVRRFVAIRQVYETLNNRYELRRFPYDRVLNVPSLSGSFMFLRVSALREVGIFDERYFMYAEDMDLTRRIHARYKTVYFPGATVTHEHTRASYKGIRMMLIHAANVVRYFNKWGWFRDPGRRITNARVLSALLRGTRRSGPKELESATWGLEAAEERSKAR